MGNLIQNIPVNRPPQTTVTRPASQPVFAPNTNPLLNEIQNRYPQDKIYSYILAEPISPARTTPAGISARQASGELIKENIFQSMSRTVKSYGDYAKYFYNAAFKGEGKDYSVGKINDLTLRAGSLGIATVLATSKMFPFAKGMEFVGLATWFASMAIWPKVLGMPIKAIYGVDINQKYRDSDGRVKDVFEDNQYRPMDIYRYVDKNGKPLTKEQYQAKYDHDFVYLEKIGNKLGIEKDIKDRNEATVNKMSQIAVQGKTLWMLTAGVMTPVLSSLAADALQTPLKKLIETSRYQRQTEELKKFEQTVETLLGDQNHSRVTDIDKLYENLGIKIPEKTQKQFESLLTENGELTPEQFKKLNKFLERKFHGSGFYTSIEAAMKKDARMTEPFVTVNQEFKQQLVSIVKESFDEVVSKLPDDKKAMLPEEIRNYKGLKLKDIDNLFKEIYLDGVSDLDKTQQNLLKRNLSTAAIMTVDEEKQGNTLARAAVDRARQLINTKLEAIYDSKRHHIVSKNQVEKIFKFAEMNRQIRGRLNLFERATIKNIAESATAISWETLPQKYVKAIGFTNKELAVLATVDSAKATRVIAEKFENIAKNPEKYKQVLQAMSEYAKGAISKEEKAVIQLIGTIENPGLLFKVKDLMESSARANFGGYFQDTITTYYLRKISAVQRKLRNTIDSFVRPIKALDVFKNLGNLADKIVGDTGTFNFRREHDWHYQMFEKMDVAKAKAAMGRYLKDIVLTRNDVNNWTTKMEAELPLGTRGFKNSFPVLCSIAEQVFGELHPETAAIITGDNMDKIAENKALIRKINVNNWIMKSRFLRIDYKLSEQLGGKNYMRQGNALGGFIEDLKNRSKVQEASRFLSEVLEDRMADLGENIADGKQRFTFEKLQNYKKLLHDFASGRAFDAGYNMNGAINCLKEASCFGFLTANKAVAEASGKNVTEFLASAAQNVRSRNKWLKLVYGLLTGTVAVSAYTIAMMGKNNNLNKEITNKQSSQGALK